MTASQLRHLVRTKAASRREIVQAHLDRAAARNAAVNAIVEQRAEKALAEADAADRDSGDRSGLPLDGIPVSIKDTFDVTGMRHTEGIRSMAERVSPADAVAVARLRAAGAIVIGKCNQPDFQMRWNTVSDLYGPTRNPRDLSRSVGGSSGGDAAAVATGMAPLGLGADYGGSIRLPAAWCGIYGLRPTPGTIPSVAALPPLDAPPTIDVMASIGPLARSVEDLWTALQVMAGSDPRDPTCCDRPLTERRASRRPRVARMCRETGAHVDPEVEAQLDGTVRILADAGYEVVEAGIPEAERAPEVWAELVHTELLRSALPVWGELMGESGRHHIEQMAALFDLGADVGGFVAAFIERRAIARLTGEWMEEHPLVVAPVAGMTAPPLDYDYLLDRDSTLQLFDRMRSVVWVNALGLPSVALPNGIQIVGRRFREAEIIDAAACVELGLGPVRPAMP